MISCKQHCLKQRSITSANMATLQDPARQQLKSKKGKKRSHQVSWACPARGGDANKGEEGKKGTAGALATNLAVIQWLDATALVLRMREGKEGRKGT